MEKSLHKDTTKTEEERKDRLEKLKKTIIMVGASSGIGFETALRMLGRGFSVANISRTPCALSRVKNYTADISNGTAMEKAIAEIASQTENLYGLVYCAGFSMAAPIEYASERDYRYLFEVNYFGALRAIRTVVPFLKEKGGRILLVSSMASIFPVAFDSFYSSSKAAVDMLVKSAAIELEPYRIRVSSVQPGGTSTEFTFKRKIYSDTEAGEYAPQVKRAAEALAQTARSIGSMMSFSKALLETEKLFALTIAAVILSVVCEWIIRLIGRAVIKWK